MAKCLKKTGAFTLLELLMVTLLLSLVFLAAAGVYVSGLKFLKSMQSYSAQGDVLYAMEQIVRKLDLANFAVVDPTNQQLVIRLDYPSNSTIPNNTPSVYADDTWLKFAIIGGHLYWRQDPTEAPDVDDTDDEVVPGLVLQPGSQFSLINPSTAIDPVNPGIATVVNIILIAQIGDPPANETVNTSAMVGAWPKN